MAGLGVKQIVKPHVATMPGAERRGRSSLRVGSHPPTVSPVMGSAVGGWSPATGSRAAKPTRNVSKSLSSAALSSVSPAPLRGAQLLAPSRHGINDAARTQNSGRRFDGLTNYSRAAKQLGIQNESSWVPSSSSTGRVMRQPQPRPDSAPGGNRGDRDDAGIPPQTPPQLQRADVRMASKVGIGMAETGSPTASTPVPSSPLPNRMERVGGGFVDPNAPVKDMPKTKSVSWTQLNPDATDASVVHPNSLIDPLKRSRRLLQTLHTLRRSTGKRGSLTSNALQEGEGAEAATAEVAEGSDDSPGNEETPEEPLMHATLRDLTDTVASLSEIEAQLASAQDPLESLGGCRHPTALISARTLAVVRHKIQLLTEVEERLAHVQAATDQRDDLHKLLVRNDAPPEVVLEAAPEAQQIALRSLKNIKGFIADHAHKDGDPAEANKSHFEIFASSFGLPAKHQGLKELAKLAKQAFDFWAASALTAAEQEEPEEVEVDVIKRLMTLAESINHDKEHPDLEKAQQVITDRAGRRCMYRATDIFDQEDSISRDKEFPAPDMAKRCADLIEAEIKNSINVFGANPKDLCMQEAKRLSTVMYMEEKNRFAKKALQFAQEAWKRDQDAEERAKAAGGPEAVPEVGPASALADSIEAEVARLHGNGAPANHAALKEAQDIAKKLRDEDGTRKRMAARQERLAKKAAADAAAASEGKTPDPVEADDPDAEGGE